jgi:hypothetical protein
VLRVLISKRLPRGQHTSQNIFDPMSAFGSFDNFVFLCRLRPCEVCFKEDFEHDPYVTTIPSEGKGVPGDLVKDQAVTCFRKLLGKLDTDDAWWSIHGEYEKSLCSIEQTWRPDVGEADQIVVETPAGNRTTLSRFLEMSMRENEDSRYRWDPAATIRIHRKKEACYYIDGRVDMEEALPELSDSQTLLSPQVPKQKVRRLGMEQYLEELEDEGEEMRKPRVKRARAR